MGPRSDERGNSLDTLSNDADRRRASMGPRSDERGNPDRALAAVCHVIASMGPRSMSAEIAPLYRW